MGLGKNLKIKISNKFPDDADAVGPKDQVLKSIGFVVRSRGEMSVMDAELIETLRG